MRTTWACGKLRIILGQVLTFSNNWQKNLKKKPLFTILALIVCGNWTPQRTTDWCQWASCSARNATTRSCTTSACASQISGHLHYIPLRNKLFWQACGWRVHTCNVRNVPHISTSTHIVSIGIKCTCEISPLDKRVLTIDILHYSITYTTTTIFTTSQLTRNSVY